MSACAACLDVLPAAAIPGRRRRGGTASVPAGAQDRSGAALGPGARRVVGTTGGRPAAPSRLWLAYVAVICSLAAVCAVVPVDRARWLVPLGGAAALTALLGAALRARRRDRGGVSHAFVLLAAGLALTVVSELLAAAGGPQVRFGTPVALSAYPFLLAGLVALNGTRVHEHAIDTLLVAAIVPSAIFAFGWLPMVEAVERWAGSSGGAGWEAWLLLAVGALAVAVIARLAVLFRGRPVAYQMLLGAMACLLGAHLARVIAATTRLVPAPFGTQALLLVGFALMAGACLHPSVRPLTAVKTRADSIGHGHLLLLIAVVLVGPVFALLRYGDRGTWVLLVAAGPATVSLLVVAHLARLIKERQRLEYLSTHDALTGLPNRTAFHDRLALLLGRATAADGPSVLFLDLDRFKHVNDTFGHEAGDELLREVALRLREAVRADDTVARLAGDEFALLLASPAGASRAEDVAQRVRASFAEPFHVAGAALSVTPSLGLALAPEHGTDVETLLRNADSAMYAAKAGGRNTFRTFSPGMASAAERHLLLETRFRRAISDGELVVHYQPRVDTVSRQLVGVEALVRWDHPTIGVIPPGAFIPMAESTGAIADLGKWVLEQACVDAARWQRAGSPVAVSVNVSARQFVLQDVPAVVERALSASGLPAAALELELTESMHLSDDGSVSVALQRISALGVTCAVDDFGTGYSSIAVLRDYPIGVVKLDQSFVQPVGGSVDAPLVRGVVELARGLGMRVVAEGVETQAQLDFLAGIMCDEIQGFLVSRAVPAAHITTVIRDGGGDPSRVTMLNPVVLDVTERRLVELLWAEQESSAEAVDDERETRFAAVLGAAATVMAVPIVLGLGAGGGLPPVLQTQLMSVLAAGGVELPQPLLVPPPKSAGTVQVLAASARVQPDRAVEVVLPSLDQQPKRGQPPVAADLAVPAAPVEPVVAVKTPDHPRSEGPAAPPDRPSRPNRPDPAEEVAPDPAEEVAPGKPEAAPGWTPTS